MFRVGLISDTHGLLRPEAVAFLHGCDHIVHGGDIGRADILDALATLAPVTAVRGNNDQGTWAQSLRETEQLQLGGVQLFVIHDIAHLDIAALDPGVRVVVCGHSHKPRIDERHGILVVNPGSAGPRRFRLPVSVAELVVDDGGSVSARSVELQLQPAVRSQMCTTPTKSKLRVPVRRTAPPAGTPGPRPTRRF
jgi:putative phosphoesterase